MSKNQKPKPPSAGAATQESLLFIDAIEDGHARLLLGQEAFEVPRRLLPPDAREGTWVRWSLQPAPPPADQAAAIRTRLSDDDDGGGIKL